MKYAIAAVTVIFFLAVLSPNCVAADAITLAQTVQAGGMGQYLVELANETPDSHTYRLAARGLPDGLALTFVQTGPVIEAVTLAPHKYGLVTLRVGVPSDTGVGRYVGAVVATRDDGEELIIPIVLNVENTYAIEIISQNMNVTTFRGQTFAFDVTAANTGAATLTDVSLAVDAPATWDVQVDPATVSSLDPGAEATYHASVTVPTSQTAMDQSVLLSMHSDQVDGAQSSLSVRVQNNPRYLAVAGGIVAIGIAGVVFYFRVSGRR